MEDVLISPYGLDLMTMFSIRPPELSFVRSPKLYLSYFTHDHQIKKCHSALEFVEENLNKNVFNCMWINGANQQVRIREDAIIKVLKLQNCKGDIRKLLINLQCLCEGKEPIYLRRKKNEEEKKQLQKARRKKKERL